jgi:hypothetical protein
MRTGFSRFGWVLLLLIPVAGCSQTVHRARSDMRCDQPIPISYNTPVLNVIRIYTGPDGLSHSEMQRELAQTTAYLGASLQQFHLGDPTNAIIMTGPPNFLYPKHAAPYREIFLVLAGSMSIDLSDGTVQQAPTGSLVLFEDVTGAGHGGRFGACGYVALDLQYQVQPTAPAAR